MKKKTIIVLLAVSASAFFTLFCMQLGKVFYYFKHPLEFSFTTLFYVMTLAVALFGHMAAYVHFMDMKPKVSDITDIEEWWTKWDQA